MYRRILAPLDASRFATGALAYVAVACRAFEAHLIVATVWDEAQSHSLRIDLPLPPPTGGPQKRRPREDQERVERYISRVASATAKAGVQTTDLALEGVAHEEILRVAQAMECDLIAMVPRTHQQTRQAVIGSVTERVLHRASIPVLVVRTGPTGFFVEGARSLRKGTRLIVPLDGTGEAEAALPHAVALAEAVGATVHLLSIVPPEEDSSVEDAARAESEAYLARLVGQFEAKGIESDCEVAVGDAPDVIVMRARRDRRSTVVMTTGKRVSGRGEVLGSVADQVIRRAPSPVLVVPAPRT